MDTLKQYWRTWLWRDAVTKIITINFVVWLVISCGLLFGSSSSEWISVFVLPASLFEVMMHPWTLLTHMFTQIDFLHLLTNMLWLLLFGELFERTQGERSVWALYLCGGLLGAASFIALSMIREPVHAVMYGASSAVLAIVGASIVLYPKWEVNLLIFGSVKLIWLGIVAAVFFVLLSEGLDQAIAHGVGLLTGVVYALAQRYMPTRQYSTANERKPLSQGEMAELDILLAKVGRSGYASLSSSERQRLFNLSQRAK